MNRQMEYQTFGITNLEGGVPVEIRGWDGKMREWKGSRKGNNERNDQHFSSCFLRKCYICPLPPLVVLFGSG